MVIKITPSRPLALALVGLLAAVAACSGRHSNAQAEDGSVDESLEASSDVPSVPDGAAPGVHVTRTDGRSVVEAATYQLNERNFGAFMAAAERLAALEQQDSVVRDYLDVEVTDAGSPDAETGRNWLEANQQARAAINGAGLSVREYYVASIAIGSVDRFLRAPKSAPRTPALTQNARFLKSHVADLARLRELRDSRP